MLVLARQLNERIVLPTVPVTIEVVGIKPNGVRLGIDAPASVTILREEVLRRGNASIEDTLVPPEGDAATRLNRIRRVLNNRLQTVALSLDLLREQLEEADADSQAMLRRLGTEVKRLDEQLRELLSPSAPSVHAPLDLAPCFVVESEEFSI